MIPGRLADQLPDQRRLALAVRRPITAQQRRQLPLPRRVSLPRPGIRPQQIPQYDVIPVRIVALDNGGWDHSAAVTSISTSCPVKPS
jgi:hypothetical protein